MSGYKKIGGEFPFLIPEYSRTHDLPDVFASGRDALKAIIADSGINTIHLPYYICESVVNACKESHIKILFYEPDTNLEITEESINNVNAKEGLLLISYFGIIDIEDTIDKISKNRSDIVLIADYVQDYYSFAESKASYKFTSLRKTLPTPDGALAYKENRSLPVHYPLNSFYVKKTIGGILKHNGYRDDEYLQLLEQGENELNNAQGISKGSDLGKQIVSNTDTAGFALKRINNANTAISLLKSNGIKLLFNIDSVKKAPLCIPFFAGKRNELKKLLMLDNIFLPVHWPLSAYNKKSELAIHMSNHVLSVVIDHRYTQQDIEHQLKKISNYYE